MELKSIAIIPARGGSKGLQFKNMKLLNGKPLLSYTIEAALDSRSIDKVVITSENEKILNFSSKYDITVLKRPMRLASDTASSIDVIFNVIKKMRDRRCNPEIIILLQPTSPLRITKDIDNAIDLFQTNDCGSVVSVKELSHSPYWSFLIENQYLIPLFKEKFFNLRRQDLQKVYSPNGAIYISSPKEIKNNKGFFSDKTLPYIMPNERSIDIDTVIDFKLAEIILRESIDDFQSD